jgi:hypothetical protein
VNIWHGTVEVLPPSVTPLPFDHASSVKITESIANKLLRKGALSSPKTSLTGRCEMPRAVAAFTSEAFKYHTHKRLHRKQRQVKFHFKLSATKFARGNNEKIQLLWNRG